MTVTELREILEDVEAESLGHLPVKVAEDDAGYPTAPVTNHTVDARAEKADKDNPLAPALRLLAFVLEFDNGLDK